MEHEKQIKEGQVNVEPVTDAMNLVFGKEKGGFLRVSARESLTTDISMLLAAKGHLRKKLKILKLHCIMENLSLRKKMFNSRLCLQRLMNKIKH